VNKVLAAGKSPSPAYATPLGRPITATAAMSMVLMASLLAHAGKGEEEIEDIGPDASREDSQDSESGRDFAHRTTPCELEHIAGAGSLHQAIGNVSEVFHTLTR
jgi:hypothetical protein